MSSRKDKDAPGEIAEIQRQVAEIRRKFGADRQQVVEILKAVDFTRDETRELKQAMDAAAFADPVA